MKRLVMVLVSVFGLLAAEATLGMQTLRPSHPLGFRQGQEVFTREEIIWLLKSACQQKSSISTTSEGINTAASLMPDELGTPGTFCQNFELGLDEMPGLIGESEKEIFIKITFRKQASKEAGVPSAFMLGLEIINGPDQLVHKAQPKLPFKFVARDPLEVWCEFIH